MKALTAKNWGEAERLLRITIHAAPDFAPAWNSLGAVCQYQKKTEDARDAYEHAVKLDPDLLTAYLNLARLEIGREAMARSSEGCAGADQGGHEPSLPGGVSRWSRSHVMRCTIWNGAQATLDTALPLDKKHELPQIEYFMGAVLGAKGDREGGAVASAEIFELAPKGSGAEEVKTYLDNLASANATALLPAPAESESAAGRPSMQIFRWSATPGFPAG